MYINKHKPDKLIDFIAPLNLQERSRIKDLLNKISNWKKSDKPILIYSYIGTGKTTLIYLIAKELNMNIIELNLYNINSFDLSTINPIGVDGRKNMLLIDDIDSILECGDRIDFKEIFKLNVPIIITAADKWSEYLSEIREFIKQGKIEEFEYKLSKESYINIIKNIIVKEKIKIDKEQLDELVNLHYPDVRAAINDLEVGIAYRNNSDLNIFKILNYLFNKSKYKYNKIVEALNSNLSSSDYQNFLNLVEMNLINIYTKTEAVEAYKYLADADLYILRSRRGRYLDRYVIKILSGISLLNPKSVKRVYYRKKLSETKIDLSYAKTLHMSKKKLNKYIKLLKTIKN